jgi:hypothetical protein
MVSFERPFRGERAVKMLRSDLRRFSVLCSSDPAIIRKVEISSNDGTSRWEEPASLAFDRQDGRLFVVMFVTQLGFLVFMGSSEGLAAFYGDLLDTDELVGLGTQTGMVPDVQRVVVWSAEEPLNEDLGFGVQSSTGWSCWVEEGDEAFRPCGESDCQNTASRIASNHKSQLSRHEVNMIRPAAQR